MSSQDNTESVTLKRHLHTSAEKAFAAWSKPDILASWFGCAPGQKWQVHAWDVTEGGKLHVSTAATEDDFHVEGAFTRVEWPASLSYTWDSGQEVNVVFDREGDGCTLTVQHSGIPAGDMPAVVTGGWTAALEDLAYVVS